MTGQRERLPNRRRSVTDTVEVGGQPLHVSAGFARDGRLLEVFVSGVRPGSDRDLLAADVAVLLSRLLQHHDQLDLLARGVGRLPGGEPASLIGAIVDRLLGMARS